MKLNINFQKFQSFAAKKMHEAKTKDTCLIATYGVGSISEIEREFSAFKRSFAIIGAWRGAIVLPENSKTVKIIPGSHFKLLVINDDVWVGSFNWVAPTYLDIAVKVTNKNTKKQLIDLFFDVFNKGQFPNGGVIEF